jgi:preprotein translocase subunit SecE
MSDNGQASTSAGMDIFKWLIALAIVVVGVGGNNYFANEYSVLERTLALLPMAAVAAFIAMQTLKGQAFFQLVKASRAEIRRVVWPTRQETTQTTLVVVLVVVVMALILWALDAGFNKIISLVIG